MADPVSPKKAERFHDMDLARAIILLTGVFFHAAFLYSMQEDWYATSSFKWHPFDLQIAFMRMFRMEALFIVSGFFSAMLVSRSGSKGFVINRFIRMGVPLAVCGLAFNSGMIFLSDESSQAGWTWLGYIASGRWQAHLWNVGNLLGYESIIFSILWMFPRLHASLSDSKWVTWSAIPAYLAIGVVAYAIWQVAPSVPVVPILIHPEQFAMYANAYLLGYVIHQNAALRESLFRPVPMLLAVVGLFLLRRWIGNQDGLVEALGVWIKPIDLAQHLARALLLFGFVRTFQTDNIWVKRISLASYTIYIVHMPLQIALFRLIDPVLPNLFGYFAVSSVSLGLSWWFHVSVVERWKWAGFLVNGKVYTPRTRSF